MSVDLKRFCVSPEQPLLEVMARINENGAGIALVIDAQGRLTDTITDGDLRRAVLASTDLSQPISTLLRRRTAPPVTMPVGTGKADLIHTMKSKVIRQLPLLDAAGKLADLVFLDDLVEEPVGPELTAVVMAGGFGTRLMPLTKDVPKPMLEVGERPLVEHTVERLRKAGIQRVYMATHYKAEALTEHFGDGQEFGVDIRYVDEEVPLGTAGALAQLNGAKEPFLVINGDIMTDLNFRSLLDFHREHEADMTVGVRQYEFSVPYGVVSTIETDITGITEKPTQRMFVNAGIYLIEPEICGMVPRGQHFDMTDLIQTLLVKRRRVVAFPISEYWVDIGRVEDYEKARGRAAQKG